MVQINKKIITKFCKFAKILSSGIIENKGVYQKGHLSDRTLKFVNLL
jgi:hypothetical protein